MKRSIFVLALCLVPTVVHAEAAFEVNVLWPFFPGGITELKVMLPIVNTDTKDWRGELLLGTYADYAWRVVRDSDAGKVSYYAAKIGYRQFLVSGWHLEAVTNLGWRHEEQNPHNGTDLDGFAGRLFLWGGWQTDLSESVYANARAGAGIHLFRTDRFARFEEKLVPAVDLNLGFRF